VRSMSIRMPRGSAHEGVCIAAGVTAVGGACEQRKENGVHGGGRVCRRRGCGVSGGTSGGIMESLICELVEVQASGSLQPTVEVHITWSIRARLSDSVLGH
jgi:hypothetical protein